MALGQPHADREAVAHRKRERRRERRDDQRATRQAPGDRRVDRRLQEQHLDDDGGADRERQAAARAALRWTSTRSEAMLPRPADRIIRNRMIENV